MSFALIYPYIVLSALPYSLTRVIFRPNYSNVGLPFYGRSFLATLGSTLDGFDQAFAGAADLNTWADDEGTPQVGDAKIHFPPNKATTLLTNRYVLTNTLTS